MFKESKQSFLLPVLILILILSGYVYGEGGEGPDKIAFVPFESSLAVGPELAEKARISLALTMKERELFSPHRLDIWLNDKYADEKAENVDEIVTTMKKAGFDVLFLCQGIIFKVGEIYGLKVSLYTLDDTMSDSHYMRYFEFSSMSEEKIDNTLKEISNQICDEMNVRAKLPKKLHFNKTLYIEKFGINLIQISEIKATSTKVPTILPIISIDGIEYKGTDHFFHEILLYRLHTSRLFSLKANNISNYIQDPSKAPKDADYVVSGHLFIMENYNILMIDIKKQKTDELVQSYLYPFTELTVESLEKAMQKNALLIGLSVLELKEREKVGTAEIVLKDPDLPVYCNDYFLGINDQIDLLLPFGQSDIRISNKMYKMFVYPYTKNYQYWEIEDSVLTQILSIIEEE